MRKVILASVATTVLATLAGGGVRAQSETRATTGMSSAPAPKALSATGRIVGFDGGSRTLTLATAKGDEKFVLGSRARLQEGAKTITPEILSSLAGHQAKVRYTGSGSDKAAESVMVSGGGRAKSSK